MLVSTDSRNFAGKTRISRDLRPPFLRRNLNYILDQHDLADSLIRLGPDATQSRMIANERHQAGWDYPTTEMLTDLMQGNKPVLHILSIQLRHTEIQDSQVPNTALQTQTFGDPDWLPHPDDGYAQPCQVIVEIADSQSLARQVYVNPGRAKIQRKADGHNHPLFDVQLEQSFAIELKDLFVVQELGSNGTRHWKRTSNAKYTLNISIQCEDADDTADILSQLEGQPRAAYQDIPAAEGELRVSWSDLPMCPAKGNLLDLWRTKGGKTTKLQYGAEICVGWMRRHESALVRANLITSHDQAMIRQLPTPSASDDLDGPPSKCNVTYYYRERDRTRVTKREGFECIFCRGEGEHSSFERLQLHYEFHHEHFKFEFKHDHDGKGGKSITVGLNEAPLSTQNESDFSWVAPAEPFNFQKFVNRAGSWKPLGISRYDTGSFWRRGKHLRGIGPESSQTLVKRPPAEVQDLPPPKRKQNPVPNVPGVRFFRSISKQTVLPGTTIDDSDDDIDERWLEQSQRHQLVKLGLDGDSQYFHELLNRHLDVERVSSDVFVPETVVRFTRQHRSTLRDTRLHAAFRNRLNQLHSQDMISDETLEYCLSLVASAPATEGGNDACTTSPTRAGAERTPRDRGHAHGAVASASEQTSSDSQDIDMPMIQESPEAARPVAESLLNPSHPTTTLPPPPPPPPANGTDRPRDSWRDIGTIALPATASAGLRTPMVPYPPRTGPKPCVCGRPVTRFRDAIGCANPACSRDFHLACVGLALGDRDLNWRCEDCKK